jgi:flagellar biosynthesis/type III secretory pathway protein FliH
MGAVWFFLGCACGFGVARLIRWKMHDWQQEIWKEAGKIEEQVWQEMEEKEDLRKGGHKGGIKTYKEGCTDGYHRGYGEGYEAGVRQGKKFAQGR